MVPVRKQKTKNLIDVCVSLDDFKKLHITEIENSEWVEVEFNGELIGMARSEDIKTLNLENKMNSENVRIRNHGTGDFKPIFEHPLFQRRKPQLVSMETLNTDLDQIYLLKNGQKTGPFAVHDLHMMMRTREILPTDLVSIDQGQTFIKLYQIDGFDRRALKSNTELPSAIDDYVVIRARENMNDSSINKETLAMASLAHIGQVKATKMSEKLKEEKLESELKQKYTIYSKVFFVAFIGLTAFGAMKLKSFFPLNFFNSTKNYGEQAEVLTPVGIPFDPTTKNNTREMSSIQNTQIEDSPRNNIKFENNQNFENREINSVVPRKIKSFDQSRVYKNQKMNANQDTTTQFIEPAETYYDDNPAPIELDPVQSQVAKETYEEGEVRQPDLAEGEIAPAESPKASGFDQNIAN